MKYKVPAMSNSGIVKLTQDFRKSLGYKKDEPIDVLWVLEYAMREMFKRYNFDFVVKPIEEMSEHAYTDSDKIYIREDIYDRAFNGEGRDRFTIAHEIGHYILHTGSEMVRFHRIYPGDNVKPYEDSEWQADSFAGEFLCPAQSIKGMDAQDVAAKYGISIKAANAQLKKSRRCFQQ